MFVAARPIWWLPTFGFFLFVAIESAMFLGRENLFEDPAVGRHLRTADFILTAAQVPRTDPLSFTAAGKPWIDYEWAFEATLGELRRAGGLPLIDAFCYAIFAATLLGIYRTLLHAGLPLGAVVLTTGIAYLTLHMHFEVRPVLFTYLFLALVVEIWFRRTQPAARDWLFLPPVFVAWANLHAGWAAALVFLTLALAGRTFDRLTHRVRGEDAPLLPWFGLGLLCLLATGLNPWSWGLHRHIANLFLHAKSFALWNEYQPPDFAGPSMAALTILFIVGTVFLARSSRRASPWQGETLAPVLFFLLEGLKTQRHVLLLMVVAAVPVARELQLVLENRLCPGWLAERLRLFQERQRLGRGDAWLALLAAFGFAFVLPHTMAAKKIIVGGSVTPRLLSFLREHPDRFHRPLTTTWNAGPLLWAQRPDFRVAFDDRGDFYGDDTVFSFVHLYNGAPGWRETLERGGYDSAILDPYLELNQLLHDVPGWREVYRDDHAVVYWQDRP